MGRWAQRRRRGAGGPSLAAAPTITIDSVTTDPGDLAVTQWAFSAAINVADFSQLDFHNDTAGGPGVAVFQTDAVTLEVDMLNPATPGDTWRYNGSAPDVITPQTGAMV